MTKRTAITLLGINILAAAGAVALVIFLYSHRVPLDSGVTTERLDIAAARLATQQSRAAIAEILHHDDSYIQSLLHVSSAQQTLLCWSAIAFGFVAVVNGFYLLPAIRKSAVNA